MVKTEIAVGETSYPSSVELAALLRTISNRDTLRILFLTDQGIRNSTHAIEELDITSKRYYSRLKSLIESGLIKKVDGIYRQTALGKIMHDRFLPAMGRTFEARDRLELLMHVEGTDIELEVKRIIEDELDIPGFAESSNMKMLGDYETLAIEVIDLCESAKESILLASNYMDVRVMEATFRSLDRGVVNRIFAGKKSLSSKLKQLKMMLSLTFSKVIINIVSNDVELTEFVRFGDLPYTFCVVDGHHNIIEISNPTNERFIVAFSIDDRGVSEELTDLFEEIWKTGDSSPAMKFLSSLKSN